MPAITTLNRSLQEDWRKFGAVWATQGDLVSFVCLLAGWLACWLVGCMVLFWRRWQINGTKVILNLIAQSGNGMIMWQIYAIFNGLYLAPGNLNFEIHKSIAWIVLFWEHRFLKPQSDEYCSHHRGKDLDPKRSPWRSTLWNDKRVNIR